MDDMGTDGAVPSPNTPRGDEPLEAQNLASEDDKIDGILLQTQADLPHATAERTADVIAQRLHDAGIVRDRDEIQRLAARIGNDT